jgi:hypothetical protein
MSAVQNLSPERQKEVRTQVRALLDRTPSYQALDADSRRDIAKGLVNVVAFLADPAAGQKDIPDGLAGEALAAEGLATKTGAEKLQDRLAGKQNLVGKDYEAAALKAGTAAFRDMVGAVDFPKFVSGLIEGVFTSIVDSSIRQMEAYGKLLEAVVKSVEEFAADNISANQGRDYLAERFPDTLTVKIESGNPKIALKDGVEEEALARVKAAMGGQDIDLDDEESEAELARRAQLEMARVRQQQLATMVLLGINRIIVTDGLINAKVVFDMKASDTAERTNRASMYDTAEKKRQTGSGGGWFSGDYDNTQEKHKTVVSSSTTDESESKASIKANLTGEVRVNFKSETFPLERMASSGEIASVNQRAQK